MKRAAMFAALGVASACVGFNIRASSQCTEVCDTLNKCGFLPSSLGWAQDGDPSAAREDCIRRCNNSSVDDPMVAKVLACFASAEQDKFPAEPWCAQTEGIDTESSQGEWEPCPQLGRCLQRNLDSQYILGNVDLTVQLMTSDDYATHLGFPALDWPPAAEELDSLQGCLPALCDSETCRDLDCSLEDCEARETGSGEASTGAGSDAATCREDCELPDGIVCGTELCRVGGLSISMYCDTMQVQKITIGVYSRQRLPAIEVLQDASAGINVDCAESSLRIGSEFYWLRPGPLMVVAQIEGEQLGADLQDIGYFDFPGTAEQPVDGAAQTAYCIEMLGPAMSARAGENTAVVPLGDLAALKANEVVWRPCP